MIVVADTNTLVSASIRVGSTPHRAVLYARSAGRLIVSADTSSEAVEVLSRTKFDRYVPLDARLRTLTELLDGAGIIVAVVRVAACRDPKDDMFLELAVGGHATHLITGDADLLALHPFRGVAIVTAADFLAACGA